MSVRFVARWLRTLFFHGAAFTMLGASAVLLTEHAEAIADAGEVSLPLVAELPTLERKLDALTEQVEMAELQAALRQGSQAERVGVLILPEEPDFDRLVALFDVLREVFQAKGTVKDMSQINIGDSIEEDHVNMRPVHLTFSAHDDGLDSFLTFVQLAGLLTVGDTLSAEERALLIQRTEEENPTGIVALEQFFSTDLVDYVENPRSYEEQVQRSFSSSTFQSAFRSILQTSLLREARLMLESDLGKVLMQHELWPSPFIVVDAIRVERGNAPKWQKVSVQLLLYTRK